MEIIMTNKPNTEAEVKKFDEHESEVREIASTMLSDEQLAIADADLAAERKLVEAGVETAEEAEGNVAEKIDNDLANAG
jgi:hypothetical protein